MNTQTIDEDSVDFEALQAQIDLSMSFAQNLISSWMEPHKFPRSSRRQNLEQELTEYMKKPPRLGVGASIPEGGQSQTREVVRLKGKLAGSKRPREEADLTTTQRASDDEDERRPTIIKKKVRSDPFDVNHGKKIKKINESEISILQTNTSSFSGHDEKKKKKDEKLAGTRSKSTVREGNLGIPDSSDEVERSLTPNETSVSPVKRVDKHEVDAASETSISSKTIPSRNSQSTSSSIDTIRIDLSREITMSPTKFPTSHKPLPAELLKIPLLNLSGPPSDLDSDCDPATPSTSPKKKRKRRKKKKNHTLSVDNSHDLQLPSSTI